jgi:hypothetical protein
MLVQSFFHLDCNSLIPECGFHCDQCVEEIQSVLTELDGVSEVSREDVEKPTESSSNTIPRRSASTIY